MRTLDANGDAGLDRREPSGLVGDLFPRNERGRLRGRSTLKLRQRTSRRPRQFAAALAHLLERS